MAVVMVMTETLPLSELEAHLSEVVDRVEREHDRVLLTRNGRPAPSSRARLSARLSKTRVEMLSDPNALEEIAAARDDLPQGRTLSAEEPRAKYLTR